MASAVGLAVPVSRKSESLILTSHSYALTTREGLLMTVGHSGEEVSFTQLYADYCADATDAPIIYNVFLGYALISAVTPQAYYRIGDDDARLSLYLVLLGPSSKFRKSTALRMAKNILSRIDPEAFLPSEFSHEALVSMLKVRAQGVLWLSEFSTFLSLLDRDYCRSIRGLLTDLFDAPSTYTRRTQKDGLLELKDVNINVWSASTTRWFLNHSKETDFQGGFLPRFLFIPAYEKEKVMAFRGRVDVGKQNAILLRLNEIRKNCNREITFSDEAKRAYEIWYGRYSKKELNPLLMPFSERLAAYALKFSALEAMNRDATTTINERHIREGTHLIDWLRKALEQLAEEEFAFSYHAESRKKVLAIVKAAGPEGVSKRDLSRKADLPRAQLLQVLLGLQDEERISPFRIEPKGGERGRKREGYHEWKFKPKEAEASKETPRRRGEK